MEIKGLTGNIMGLMANPNSFSELNYIERIANEQTRGVNGPLERAKQISDSLNSLKQRKPLVFEYYQAPNATAPVVVELYINPERMSIGTQKLKSKTITRGGIFYHHYGDDHSSMQIAGTTGLSAMKGIEQLEQVYHASGTLLRYQRFGPDKSYTFTDRANTMFDVIDYSDPINFSNPNDVVNFATQEGYSNSNVDAQMNIRQKLFELYTFLSVMSNISGSIEKTANELKIWSDEYKASRGVPAPLYTYYHEALDKFSKNCPGLSSDLIILLAFQHTETEYLKTEGSDLESIAALDNFERNLGYDAAYIYDAVINTEDDTTYYTTEDASKTTSDGDITLQVNIMMKNREVALTKHMNELDLHYRREYNRRTQLRGKIVNEAKTEFNDPWKPRKVICYFENRAYVGHFESFSYNRVATAPLISYELRFVIEKMVVGQFNLDTPGNAALWDVKGSTSKATPKAPGSNLFTPPNEPSYSNPGSNPPWLPGDPYTPEF